MTRCTRSVLTLCLTHAIACADDAAPSMFTGPSTTPDGGAAERDGGAGPGDGTPFSVEVADQRVSGFVKDGAATLVDPPHVFETPLVVWAVQRGTALLADEAAVRRSCAQPLGVADGLTPPSYALRAVLINPLAGAPLLKAIRDQGGPPVTHLTNPLVLERVDMDVASLQDAVPSGVIGSRDLRATDFPTGSYGWQLLCDHLASPQRAVRMKIEGSLGGTPFTGTIVHRPLRVAP